MRAQVPPEVYELFGAAGKKGEAAEKEWDSTWASYKDKYPEVRAAPVTSSAAPQQHGMCQVAPAMQGDRPGNPWLLSP